MKLRPARQGELQRGLRRVVYVSYDGMTDPLGESQVLPYVRNLADLGHQIELISFEKAPHPTTLREQVHPGVWWTGLRYHKTPTVPATVFDLTQGGAAATLLALLQNADILHVRSYVAATLALPTARILRCPLLFDMRGRWPDERVEDGTWSRTGRIFRTAKLVERELVRQASAITVLTNAMARYLRHDAPFSAEVRAPIHVIPTCTDLDRFSPSVPADPELLRQLGSSRALAYVGSFGGRYLSREMARFYLAWRRRVNEARFLVISRQDPELIRAVLREKSVDHELVHRSAAHEEVPRLLRCAEAGVFFHPPTATNSGAAPTKMGEMLASGLALAGNRVGDVPQVLTDEGVGVVLSRFDDEALNEAAGKLAHLARTPNFAQTARKVANRWFSLNKGVRAYDMIYRTLGRAGLGQIARTLADSPWPGSHADLSSWNPNGFTQVT